jgi:peptide/nickel transport system substrate-binding protein
MTMNAAGVRGAAVLILLVLSVSSLSVAYSQTTTTSSSCSSADTLTVATDPLPNSFNLLTAASTSPFEIASIMWKSLVPFITDPNGTADTTNSITDWVQHNANYTQWTFNIKEGLKWSNGQNVTSGDILGTYGTQVPYVLNPLYDVLNLRYEIVNDYAYNSTAAVFVLNKTDAQFPIELSTLIQIPIMPSAATSLGPSAPLFGTNVADGPFYSTNYTSGSPQMVMLRNPNYIPQPKICKIVYDFEESTTQLTELLLSGQTDVAGYLDPSNIPALPSFVHLYVTQGMLITPMWYNITSYPYNMTAFRQALAYSINYTQLVKQGLNGYAVPGNTGAGTLPSSAGLYDPNVAKYSYDPTQALSLLNSIGIKVGSDGFLQYPNGTDISMTIFTDTDNTWDLAISNFVLHDLQSLGFQVTLQVTKLANILADDIGNKMGIRHDLIIFSDNRFPYNAWNDAEPGWLIYSYALVPNSHWEYPAGPDAQYYSNLTALEGTANTTLQAQYLDNIQLLNSQYLPNLPLVYPDWVFAYSTQHFTGWDLNEYSGSFYLPYYTNFTLLATLQPVSGVQSTTSISSTQVSSSSATTSTTTSTSTSTTTPTTTSTTTYLLVAVVVAVLVIIGAVAVLYRRRPKT